MVLLRPDPDRLLHRKLGRFLDGRDAGETHRERGRSGRTGIILSQTVWLPMNGRSHRPSSL